MRSIQFLLYATFVAYLLLSIGEARIDGKKLLKERPTGNPPGKPPGKRMGRRPGMEPITLKIECDDENCCNTTVPPAVVEIPLQPARAKHVRILEILTATVRRNGSAYNFSTVENGKFQLMSLAGLSNSEDCEWKISVDERRMRNLRSRVKLGQTILFSYETVEETDAEKPKSDEEDSKETPEMTNVEKQTSSNEEDSKAVKETDAEELTSSDKKGSESESSTSKSGKKNRPITERPRNERPTNEGRRNGKRKGGPRENKQHGKGTEENEEEKPTAV